MVKRAKICHGQQKSTDFAPGVDNILLRKDGVDFYAPETFHSSPFYDQTTSLLVIDLINSHDIYDIYGYRGSKAVNDNVLLLKNHPIRRVRIMGRIIEYFIKDIRKKEWYFFTIGDSSGGTIVVKVSVELYRESRLKLDCCLFNLVEVSGFCRTYNGMKEIQAEVFRQPTHAAEYMDDEILFWKEAIQMRNLLKIPWYQTPQISGDENCRVKMDPKVNKEKLIRQKLNLGIGTGLSQAIVMDSHVYFKNSKVKDDYSDAMGKEIISDGERNKGDDNDDDDDEIQEITHKIFSRPKLRPVQHIKHSEGSESSSWVKVSSIPLKKMTISRSLKFELLKWMIKNKQGQFNLNGPYKERKISTLLNQYANKKFPLQTIDLTGTSPQIKTLNEIKGEIFHDMRHELQVANLIKCTRSKECFCAPVLKLYKHLSKTLDTIKFINSQKPQDCLVSDKYISRFNSENDLKVDMEIALVNVLIQWILLKYKKGNWEFNKKLNAWRYSPDLENRR